MMDPVTILCAALFAVAAALTVKIALDDTKPMRETADRIVESLNATTEILRKTEAKLNAINAKATGENSA